MAWATGMRTSSMSSPASGCAWPGPLLERAGGNPSAQQWAAEPELDGARSRPLRRASVARPSTQTQQRSPSTQATHPPSRAGRGSTSTTLSKSGMSSHRSNATSWRAHWNSPNRNPHCVSTLQIVSTSSRMYRRMAATVRDCSRWSAARSKRLSDVKGHSAFLRHTAISWQTSKSGTHW